MEMLASAMVFYNYYINIKIKNVFIKKFYKKYIKVWKLFEDPLYVILAPPPLLSLPSMYVLFICLIITCTCLLCEP